MRGRPSRSPESTRGPVGPFRPCIILRIARPERFCGGSLTESQELYQFCTFCSVPGVTYLLQDDPLLSYFSDASTSQGPFADSAPWRRRRRARDRAPDAWTFCVEI